MPLLAPGSPSPPGNSSRRMLHEFQQLALLLGTGGAGGALVGASAYPEGQRLEGAGRGLSLGLVSGGMSYGISRLAQHLAQRIRRKSSPESPTPGGPGGPEAPPIPPPVPLPGAGPLGPPALQKEAEQEDLTQAQGALERSARPGFEADRAEPSGLSMPATLLGGGSLAALAALGLGHILQAQRQRKKRTSSPAKQADFLEDIRGQLPALRLPDTVAGGALGAAGGLGLTALHRLLRPSKSKKDQPSYLRGALLGGAVGAVGGNVLGDRLRRYVSNAQIPLGYKADPEPLTLKNLWRGAVQDEPLYQAPEGQEHAVGARRELLRRSLGVHQERPDQDYWQKQPDEGYSLSGKSPQGLAAVRRLLMGPDQPDAQSLRRDVGRVNQGDVPDNLMGPIVGGQAISSLPLGPGKDLYRIRDRWDFSLSPAESDLRNRLLGKALTGGLGEDVPREQLPDYLSPGTTGRTALASLFGRTLLDKFLVQGEAPWVRQNILASPEGVTPLTGAGQPYPGLFPGAEEGPHGVR